MEWKKLWFHCAGKCSFFHSQTRYFRVKSKMRLNSITIKQIRFWNGDSLTSTIKMCTFQLKFRYSIARFKWIWIVQTICLHNVGHFIFRAKKNTDTFQWIKKTNHHVWNIFMAFAICKADRKKIQHFGNMWKPSEVNVISYYFNIRVNAFFEALLNFHVTIEIF